MCSLIHTSDKSKRLGYVNPNLINQIELNPQIACVYGLNFIEAKIPGDIFNTLDFELNVELAELHTTYRLQMLDITMMTVWCM